MVTGSSSQRKCQADTGVISIPVSVLRHRKGTRASQYFALIIRRTRANSSGGRMRAVAGNSGPVIFSADRAWSDLDLRVVADALVFPGLAARHEVEFVIVFGKPNGRVHGDATFAEGGEAYVTLAVDFGGDRSHADIVNRGLFSGGRITEIKPK